MAEATRVTGPLEIKSDTEASVAYDLAKFIAAKEQADEGQKASREYWLTLYLQCRRATAGLALKHVLERH
jgi:hypothetical protein